MAALEREKQREEQRRIELEEMRVQEEQAAEDRRKAEEEARQKAEGMLKMQIPHTCICTCMHIHTQMHCDSCTALYTEEAKELEKVRKQEEEKWEMALSGELSGPRKAALGAGETSTSIIAEAA